MSGVARMLGFGGAGDGGQAELLKAQQRRSLAELAKQQADIDQAGSGGGAKLGSQLLTFLQRPNTDVLGGSSKFGSA